MEETNTIEGGVTGIMKEYVSPAISVPENKGQFAIPAILAALAGAAASAAVKAMLDENFSALDAEPLPACITMA